jgi:cysteine desulfurase family protein (TIGR01976 family)
VLAQLDVESVRSRYSSLAGGFAFFDAPGGTQVPDEVGAAIARALREASGNLGAPYATSRAAEAILERAKRDGGRFLGCTPDEVVFGANMTTLNFTLSRVAARDFERGDEVIVTALDHDAGVAPWCELADDLGLVVRVVETTDDLQVDLDDLRSKLTERTRVVAFAWASNAVGTVAPARELCALARSVGALSWIDAVHYAAHERIDVEELGCDVLICSPYKFCGPHLGVGFVREQVAVGWRPYKARPSPSQPIGRRFETGTLAYELLAAFSATVDYLESIGGMTAISDYERELGARLIEGLPAGTTLYGPAGMDGRVPTFLLNVDGVAADEVVQELASRGYGVWSSDNWYCVGLEGRLPPLSVRVGVIHYNTAEEVDRLLGELERLVPR